MTSETLTLWENGAVTLPKEWRERYGTRHFLAKENERGYLVIMPIIDVEYYENTDGSFGLRFPSGIEMGEFVKLMKKANKNILEEEKRGKRAKKPRSARK